MKLLMTVFALVSMFSTAGDYEASAGLGHQYGGILGAQLAYKTQSTKYYGSIGLVGIAAGFQTTFNDNSKHGYGLVVGKEDFMSEDGFAFMTYDYHFDGFNNKGFVLGTGIGVTREDEAGWWADQGKTETTTTITLNIGYKF